MKRIAVVTRDEFLYKKIALTLENCITVMAESPENASGSDKIFLDIDTCQCSIECAVTMSRVDKCDLAIPFALDAPYRYLTSTKTARLIPSQREVIIGNRSVRLTELEYALFALIVAAGGNAVSREEILDRIWHGDADGGVVNVYIHYLREKLETEGERIIVAARGRGYSLTEKYAAMFGEGGDD